MALSPQLRQALNTAQNKYTRSSNSMISPKEGRNIYRILAPAAGAASWIGAAGEFWKDLGVHWIKLEPNGKPVAVVGCTDVVNQQPCPICTAVEHAISSAHDEDSKKFYTEMRAKKTVIVNVLDRSKTGDEPEILQVTGTTFGKIIEIMQMYEDAGQDITDPMNGLDIVVSRSGKGLNTEYSVTVKPGVSQPFNPEVLKKCHDLDAHIQREFFRGDEQKALNALAQLTGYQVPVHLARTPTAALTSGAIEVPGASVASAPASAPASASTVIPTTIMPTAAAVVTPPVAEAVSTAAIEALGADEIDDFLKDLEGI